MRLSPRSTSTTRRSGTWRDRIVGIGRIRTRGKYSGAVTELAFGTVTDMKNGKAIRIWTYLDPQEALEAAGLSE